MLQQTLLLAIILIACLLQTLPWIVIVRLLFWSGPNPRLGRRLA